MNTTRSIPIHLKVALLSGVLLICNSCNLHKDEREVHSVRMHADRVTGVDFSSDGRILASASEDDTIRLLDVTAFHQDFDSPNLVVALPDELDISPLLGHGTGFGDVAFSPDSASLAAGNYLNAVGGAVQIFDIEDGSRTSTFTAQDAKVRALDFSPAGTSLASGSGDDLQFGDVAIYDMDSGDAVDLLGRTMGGIRSVAYSPDGALLATASASEGVQLWHADDASLAFTLRAGEEQSYAVAFSPDGTRLVSCGADSGTGFYRRNGIVRVWDPATGEQVVAFDVSGQALHALAYSSDSTLIAAAGEDHAIYLIDTQTYELVDTLEGHVGRVNTLAFSSNGKLLASGSDDRYLIIWDVGDLVGQTCNDGMDNDGDGWLDAKDPDCAEGKREIGFGSTECNDDEDNDSDGHKDAADLDCLDGFDDNESPDDEMDAGPDSGEEDAGNPPDSGQPDGGIEDAGLDSGQPDGGVEDAGLDDGGLDSGQEVDGGVDGGLSDGGS